MVVPKSSTAKKPQAVKNHAGVSQAGKSRAVKSPVGKSPAPGLKKQALKPTTFVTVNVPATSANLGPGFDVLGLSLALYETYVFRKSDKKAVSYTGLEADQISTGPDNLIFKVATILGRIKGQKLIFSAEINRTIPLSMGLGSSSAAIVATLFGLNKLFDVGLSRDQLFMEAAKIEGHPDNVAPAVYGGLTISWQESKNFRSLTMKPSPDIKACLFLPKYRLSTDKARCILGDTVKRSDAVFNIARSALIVSLLTKRSIGQDGDMLKEAFKDKLHQPKRQAILPGFKELTSELNKLDIFGSALSGAGPSVIMFYDRSREKEVIKSVDGLLKKSIKNYSYFIVGTDLHGCRVK